MGVTAVLPGLVATSIVTAALLGAAARRWTRGRRKKSLVNLLQDITDKKTAAVLAEVPAGLAFVDEAIDASRYPHPLPTLGRLRGLRAMKALGGFAVGGGRRPYSEARAAQLPYLRAVPREVLVDAARWLEFAEVVYEDMDSIEKVLQVRGFNLVYAEDLERPGAPAHFLCYSPRERCAVLSVRGTHTFTDLITDLAQASACRPLPSGSGVGAAAADAAAETAGAAAAPALGGDAGDPSGGLCAHAGMFKAAEYVIGRLKPVLKDFLVGQGYELLVTGHSLGAGTAALATHLLLQEAAAAASPPWPAPLRARCVCFAPLPVVEESVATALAGPPPAANAVAAATAGGAVEAGGGGVGVPPARPPPLEGPAVRSFVCRDDLVPRSSMHNVRRLAMLLGAADAALEARRQEGQEGRPLFSLPFFGRQRAAEKAAEAKAAGAAALKSLGLGVGTDGEIGAATDEVSRRARSVAADHLGLGRRDFFVPGEVIVLHDTAAGASAASADAAGTPLAAAPVQLAAEGALATADAPIAAWSAASGDSLLPEIRYLELVPNMVSDHLAPAYREAIQSVLASGAAAEEEA